MTDTEHRASCVTSPSMEKILSDGEPGEVEIQVEQKTLPNSLASGSSSSLRFCRICHDTDEPLLAACKCKGSIGFTHERCLIEWLLRCGKARCELCEADYLLRVRDTHGWSRLLTHRLSRHDKAMVLVNFVCVLFLISTTTWLVWSGVSPENANQRMNELFQTCYALYGFMDVFCLGIIIHEIPHMQFLWRRMKLLRYELYLLPYPGSVVGDTSLCESVPDDRSVTPSPNTSNETVNATADTRSINNAPPTIESSEVDGTQGLGLHSTSLPACTVNSTQELELRSTSLPNVCDESTGGAENTDHREVVIRVTTC